MKHTHRFTSMLFVVLVAAMICTGLEIQPSTSAEPSPASAKADDFNGDYELHGKTPRGFTGFKYFELNTLLFKPSGSVPIKPNGFVQAGRKYKMAHIEIVGGSLSFETVEVAGTAYQFKGRLLPYKPDGPALSGWLSKTVNGNKAAEAQVEFDLIEGVD